MVSRADSPQSTLYLPIRPTSPRMGTINRFRPHREAMPIASLMAAIATANAGIFEVDLLFPRNETYAPQALMPIVFALQNSTLAGPLAAFITWELWEGNNRTSSGSITDGGLGLNLGKLSSSHPRFITRFPSTLPYPDGSWTLARDLQVHNCTVPEFSN